MDKIIYNGKEIPCIASYDVTIVGGGFAGFCAAVTSESLGLKTLIIERSGHWAVQLPLQGLQIFAHQETLWKVMALFGKF